MKARVFLKYFVRACSNSRKDLLGINVYKTRQSYLLSLLTALQCIHTTSVISK